MSSGGEGGGVISLEPLIRRRKQRACKHVHVEVDDDAASLTCITCDAEIDPWWYIRRLASHEVRVREHYDEINRQGLAAIEKHNAWVVTANATIQRLNAEIQHLADVKNKLTNESVNGERLGTVARRHRRRVP